MGYLLRAGIPSQYVTSQLGQLSLASLMGRLIECLLQCGQIWNMYSRLVCVSRGDVKGAESYNAVWLRENCRCEACFVAATNQRAVVFHRLPPEAFVANRVTAAREEGMVEVTWADGHLSRYKS